MTLLKALKIVIVFGPLSAPDPAYDATFNLLWRPGAGMPLPRILYPIHALGVSDWAPLFVPTHTSNPGDVTVWTSVNSLFCFCVLFCVFKAMNAAVRAAPGALVGQQSCIQRTSRCNWFEACSLASVNEIRDKCIETLNSGSAHGHVYYTRQVVVYHARVVRTGVHGRHDTETLGYDKRIIRCSSTDISVVNTFNEGLQTHVLWQRPWWSITVEERFLYGDLIT